MRQLLAFGLLLAATQAASAQLPLAGGLDVNTGRVHVVGRDAGTSRMEDALTFGVRLLTRLGPAGLDLRYAEGSLDTADAEYVEGAVLATVRATPWLTVVAGPRAMARGRADTTRRWLAWTAGARLTGPPFAHEVLRVHGGLWVGTTSRNDGTETALGRGMETGVLAHHPQLPLILHLTYRLDEHADDDAGVGATAERVELGVGLRF